MIRAAEHPGYNVALRNLPGHCFDNDSDVVFEPAFLNGVVEAWMLFEADLISIQQLIPLLTALKQRFYPEGRVTH